MFYVVFEANFQVQAPGAGKAYFLRGDLTEGFCVTSLGVYTWRGLFLEFYGMSLFWRGITLVYF